VIPAAGVHSETVSAGTVMIDLGEVPRHRSVAPPAEEEPAWTPRHRRLFGAIVSIVLIGLGATVPVAPPLAAARLETEGRDYVLYGADHYYAFGLGEGPGDRTVTAYGLPDGEPAWRVQVLRSREGWLTVPGVGPPTMISDESSVADDPSVRDAAVVASSGRVLYRTGAQLLGIAPSGGVLLWTSRGGEFGLAAGARHLVGRDLGTGRARWSYDAPPGAWLWWDPNDGGLRTVAVQLPSGRLEMRDLEGGRLLVAADVLQPRTTAEPSGAVQLAGDLVLVEEWRDGRVWVTAYGQRRLDRRWTIPMDLASEYVEPCGDVLCVGGLNGGIRVLDAATGVTVWASDRWSFLEPVGDHLLAGPAGARPGGAGLMVLDRRTGRVRADLGRWTPVWPVPADGQPIAVRHDLRNSRSWFGRIDVVRGKVYAVGSVTGVTDDCRAGREYVTCRRPDGRTGVWQLPRA
jgi:outer membrane protein assembly factor BamB